MQFFLVQVFGAPDASMAMNVKMITIVEQENASTLGELVYLKGNAFVRKDSMDINAVNKI